MSPTKRFLLTLAAVSLVVWIAANIALGPPGMSRAYLDKHKADHDRYMEIIKSHAYKLYEERPELNKPEVESDLEEDIEFVEGYEANPEFHGEMGRRATYGIFFDFFNMALVVILVLRFARKPLLALIDGQIAALREKMDTAAAAHKKAEERLRKARDKMDHLSDEKELVAKDMARRLKREMADLDVANEHSLEVTRKELEDRQRQEQHAAERLVRAELVNAAIDKLAHDYEARSTVERERVLVGQFADSVEKLS